MSTTTKSAKRSLRTISAHGKLEAIRRVHDGESKASVARDIGVPESTLRGWCKNESKISYLSRQSSPETDESLEPKEKRIKLEEPLQPFNLSLKNHHQQQIYAPSSSEALYTPVDYTKSEIECTPKTPQNLSIKNEIPKSTASQERNRAELARLSVELGLNRPEFNNTNSNLAELAANFTLLNQWNLLVQQQLQKVKQETPKQKLPKEQQSPEDYINGWLKQQENLLNHRPNPPTTTITNGVSSSTTNSNNVQSSWFWNWYKQFGYQQAPVNEKPILYQQLTKDVENVEKSTVKVKSVLDNLLNNNNNINSVSEKKECLSYSEAVEHGEKFLKWVESCSNPSVTAVQIMQFKTLLSNVRNSDKKHSDKTKVKRK